MAFADFMTMLYIITRVLIFCMLLEHHSSIEIFLLMVMLVMDLQPASFIGWSLYSRYELVRCIASYRFLALQVACVMQASFIDPDRELMLLSGIDSAYTKQQLRNSFLMGSSFVDLLFNFASRFSSFHLTDVETALFCALMLIRPGSFDNLVHLSVLVSCTNVVDFIDLSPDDYSSEKILKSNCYEISRN